MQVREQVSLKQYSTMKLGGTAAYVADVTSRQDVSEAVAWAKAHNLPLLMIGGGSNIIWRDEGFPGLLIVNKIMGYDVYSEDEENAYITVGAGENWDSVVERAVATGKSGLEYLSLIPGTVGGAPVQNIGAYGHELSESLVSIEAFDQQIGQIINIPKMDCGFGYRTSRFKFGEDKGRFLITAITIHLVKPLPATSYYHWLEDYFARNDITNPSIIDIRNAVIEIRRSRLPDPEVFPNNGSFFANPIISTQQYQELTEDHPKLAAWPTRCFWDLPDGTYKVAAGALIEYLGLKGYKDNETGMSTWPNQSLVLVNEGAKSTADLLKFKKMITDKVQQTFGINLEQEPEILP